MICLLKLNYTNTVDPHCICLYLWTNTQFRLVEILDYKILLEEAKDVCLFNILNLFHPNFVVVVVASASDQN